MRRLLVAACLIAIASAAEARWRAEYAQLSPEVRAWYQNARDGNGQSCCDEADGHDVFGAYELTPDGGVELDSGGVRYKLKPEQVLKGPNPVGHAVWWYTAGTYNGAAWHYDRCFALGAGS